MLLCGIVNKCSDGLKSPGETDVDCGGVCVSSSKLCSYNESCVGGSDCGTGFCGSTLRCINRCDDPTYTYSRFCSGTSAGSCMLSTIYGCTPPGSGDCYCSNTCHAKGCPN
jgi:hypothetical protein